jgi:hypothetical protein
MIIGSKERRRLLEVARLLGEAAMHARALADSIPNRDEMESMELDLAPLEKPDAELEFIVKLMSDAFMKLRRVSISLERQF